MNQEKFVNQYIDLLNATVSEAIHKNLVIQAQKRVVELELGEVRATIKDYEDALKKQNDEIVSLKNELNVSRRETVVVGNEREELRKSIQHVDTFKNELVKTRSEIENLLADNRLKQEVIDALSERIIEKENIISNLLEEKNKPADKGNTWVKKTPTKKKSVKVEVVKDAGKF